MIETLPYHIAMSLQEETELKVDPQHSTSILLRLDEMRQNGEHCDCVLIVGEHFI